MEDGNFKMSQNFGEWSANQVFLSQSTRTSKLSKCDVSNKTKNIKNTNLPNFPNWKKGTCTLPETNMTLTRKPFQKENHLPIPNFQVRFVSFREGKLY